mgnify:CR=1 FL=1|tara:strand:- start:692 stop:1627 length:936 start_codon:yes stop_codon:yes gene_type:complete
MARRFGKGQIADQTPTGQGTGSAPITTITSNQSQANLANQTTNQAQPEIIISKTNSYTVPYQSTSQFSRDGTPVGSDELARINSILQRQRMERPDTYSHVSKSDRAVGFGAIEGYDPTDKNSIIAQMEAQKAWEKGMVSNVGYSPNFHNNPNVLSGAVVKKNQSFLHAEIPRITYGQAQQKSLPTNVLKVNSQLNGLKPTAEIPTTITRSVGLYEQAGIKENPLSVLENGGSAMVNPSQQYLSQLGDIIVPRPAYQAFADSQPVGIQNTANMPVKKSLDSTQTKLKSFFQGQNLYIAMAVGIGALILWKVK